jgi:hypothetical protein
MNTARSMEAKINMDSLIRWASLSLAVMAALAATIWSYPGVNETTQRATAAAIQAPMDEVVQKTAIQERLFSAYVAETSQGISHTIHQRDAFENIKRRMEQGQALRHTLSTRQIAALEKADAIKFARHQRMGVSIIVSAAFLLMFWLGKTTLIGPSPTMFQVKSR